MTKTSLARRLVCLLILAPTLARADAAHPVYMMAALGDSISAALFADTSLQDPSLPGLDLSSLISDPLLGNRDTLSWSTGQQIQSHAQHLQAYLAAQPETAAGTLKTYNFAYPKDTTAELFDQAEKVAAARELDGIDSIKYITLMIGANDSCSQAASNGVSPAQMKANLKKAFDRLAQIQQNEPLSILVAGAPRIPDLGAAALQETRTVAGLSCRIVREKILKSCDALVRWTTEAEYQKNVAIVAEKNQALSEAVQEAAQAHPNLKLFFTNAMFETPIPFTVLAADCFHPDKDGQAEIARRMWELQPFFK